MVYVMDAILNSTGNYTTWKHDKMLHTQHKWKHNTTMCTFNVVYFTISMAKYKTAVIQCVSNGVTAVLQLAIDILSLDSGYILRRLHVRCTIYHQLELSDVFYYIKVVQYICILHSHCCAVCSFALHCDALNKISCYRVYRQQDIEWMNFVGDSITLTVPGFLSWIIQTDGYGNHIGRRGLHGLYT